jgi:(1->4)-alpha-D-glucan 1-alpha-D-glucosylmutase
MRVPRSTYRLQLNAQFRLRDVRRLLDYLHRLGVSDLYLSPLLQARTGSTHGYDVIDPGHINREIGSDEEFEELAAEARARDMGILLDIVPNHMSATEANPWWRDLMEHGTSSPFARFFDIDWDSEAAGAGRLLLPFLGQSLEQCLEAGELKLVIDRREVALAYFERLLPIDSASIPVLVGAILENLEHDLPSEAAQALMRLSEQATALPERGEYAHSAERRVLARALKNALADQLERLAALQPTCLRPTQLASLLAQQPYALLYWVPGGRHVNYRRFFDVADLAGLSIEVPDVFAAVHQRILPWLTLGTISGVRIDHVDGLRYPAAYLKQLNEAVTAAAGRPPYVVVEKVLLGGEQLPSDWCTAGTTGYDFLAALNGLFIEPHGWERLGEFHHELTTVADFTDLLYDKKRQVLTSLFSGELRSLVERAACLLPDASSEALTFALTEVTACLPVYRTYITPAPTEVDYGAIDEALLAARSRGADAAVIGWLRKLLTEPESDAQRDLVVRWQQLTGPVMAKGLEDTAFYNYHRLISTCEVGSDPRQPLCSIEQFHEFMIRRQADWPASLNATSTHDTKRSEDARARINVLSELAAVWIACVQEWRALHAPLRCQVQDLEAPDGNDELLIYQTLIGAWPLEEPAPDFEPRVRECLLKSMREAKQRTTWRAPNPAYEAAILDFVSAIIQPAHCAFRSGFLRLQSLTSFYGALNSLSQLVLKLGAPGIPDFYQGTELWSLTMVDPDNRRPVDYAARRRALDSLPTDGIDPHWRAGALKMLIMKRGLQLRNEQPALFQQGTYTPVRVLGDRARNLIAFERRLQNQRALFLAPRFYTELNRPGERMTPGLWGETTLEMNDASLWRNLLTGQECALTAQPRVATILTDLPVAILTTTT